MIFILLSKDAHCFNQYIKQTLQRSIHLDILFEVKWNIPDYTYLKSYNFHRINIGYDP